MSFRIFCDICDIPLVVNESGKPENGIRSAKSHAKAHKMTPAQLERSYLAAAKAGTLLYSPIKGA